MSEIYDNKIDDKLAPFNPTCDDAIKIAFNLCDLKESDIVYDLGCGDGRVLIYACKNYSCKGIGYEYDKKFYDKAINNVKLEKLDHLIVLFLI